MPEPAPNAQPEHKLPDRRDALKGIAATGLVASATLLPVLNANSQHAHPAAASSPKPAYIPRLIVGATRELLTAVCDRIIPRTTTPGAADVGVADQIDWLASRRNGLAGSITDALQRVEAAKPGFASLTPAQQDAALMEMSADLSSDDGKAFTLLKNLTIDSYYSSQPGLQGELGWNANTYLPEFPGCTHEHLVDGDK